MWPTHGAHDQPIDVAIRIYFQGGYSAPLIARLGEEFRIRGPKGLVPFRAWASGRLLVLDPDQDLEADAEYEVERVVGVSASGQVYSSEERLSLATFPRAGRKPVAKRMFASFSKFTTGGSRSSAPPRAPRAWMSTSARVLSFTSCGPSQQMTVQYDGSSLGPDSLVVIEVEGFGIVRVIEPAANAADGSWPRSLAEVLAASPLAEVVLGSGACSVDPVPFGALGRARLSVSSANGALVDGSWSTSPSLLVAARGILTASLEPRPAADVTRWFRPRLESEPLPLSCRVSSEHSVGARTKIGAPMGLTAADLGEEWVVARSNEYRSTVFRFGRRAPAQLDLPLGSVRLYRTDFANEPSRGSDTSTDGRARLDPRHPGAGRQTRLLVLGVRNAIRGPFLQLAELLTSGSELELGKTIELPKSELENGVLEPLGLVQNADHAVVAWKMSPAFTRGRELWTAAVRWSDEGPTLEGSNLVLSGKIDGISAPLAVESGIRIMGQGRLDGDHCRRSKEWTDDPDHLGWLLELSQVGGFETCRPFESTDLVPESVFALVSEPRLGLVQASSIGLTFAGWYPTLGLGPPTTIGTERSAQIAKSSVLRLGSQDPTPVTGILSGSLLIVAAPNRPFSYVPIRVGGAAQGLASTQDGFLVLSSPGPGPELRVTHADCRSDQDFVPRE